MHKPLTTLAAIALFGQVATAEETDAATDHSYVGMWVTEDGRIRHELLPNGRYVEARGTREGAYEGRYEVTRNHIEYWDDTGFTADGDFIDGVLHHAGMILYRDRHGAAAAKSPLPASSRRGLDTAYGTRDRSICLRG